MEYLLLTCKYWDQTIWALNGKKIIATAEQFKPNIEAQAVRLSTDHQAIATLPTNWEEHFLGDAIIKSEARHASMEIKEGSKDTNRDLVDKFWTALFIVQYK